MRVSSLIVIYLILSFVSVGQTAETFDRDLISKCVVHLRQRKVEQININGTPAELWYKLPDKKPQPKIKYEMGTAFFVSYGNTPYLVTASHVAKAMSADAQVMFKATNNTRAVLSLATLHGSTSNISWTFHPNADVAVLMLDPPPHIRSNDLQKRFLPFRILLEERKAPLRHRPLIVFGFPLGLGSKESFSALTKQTHAASDLLDLNRFDVNAKATFFILEDPSIGGFSGGPVVDIGMLKFGGIKTVEGDTKVVGLIHGTISDPTGGKLAAVVPCCFIAETIMQASSAKQNKQ